MSTPTTASAVPLFVPTSASVPVSPPTMKISPMMMLVMAPPKKKGPGTIRRPAGSDHVARHVLELITSRSTTSPHDSHLSTPRPRRVSTGDQHEFLQDRKSTRLNSSHLVISYAVFCLKKKKSVLKR